MKKTLLLPLVSAWLISACSTEPPVNHTLTDSEWKVISYGTLDEQTNIAMDTYVNAAFFVAPYQNNFVIQSRCASAYGLYTFEDGQVQFEQVTVSATQHQCADNNNQVSNIAAILQSVHQIDTPSEGELTLVGREGVIKLSQ